MTGIAIRYGVLIAPPAREWRGRPHLVMPGALLPAIDGITLLDHHRADAVVGDVTDWHDAGGCIRFAALLDHPGYADHLGAGRPLPVSAGVRSTADDWDVRTIDGGLVDVCHCGVVYEISIVTSSACPGAQIDPASSILAERQQPPRRPGALVIRGRGA